jgi:Flp pilus assembly pilin Flp
MRKLFSKMWKDDAGIVALEYLLVASVLGMALVVGLAALSSAINAELTELANAILALDQGYSVASQSTCTGFKAGSEATGTALNIGYGKQLPIPTLVGNQNVGTNITVCP